MKYYVIMQICSAISGDGCFARVMNDIAIPHMMGCLVAMQQIEAQYTESHPEFKVTDRRCAPERRVPYYLDRFQA